MFLDKRIDKAIQKEVSEFITEAGKDFYINYYTRIDCPYDNIDGVYKTGTNPHCSTCDGTGYLKSYNPLIVKGIMVSNRYGIDKNRAPIDVMPVGQIRADFYLKDVLLNFNSADSGTVFDSCDYVRVNSKRYSVKDTRKIGFYEGFLVQVVLDEIK